MKIEDICTRICSGGTPKSGKAEYYENGTIPWLNTKEINFNRIQATETFITEEGLNNSSAKWIKPHAVIVAMYGATAGRVAVAETPLTTNQPGMLQFRSRRNDRRLPLHLLLVEAKF